MSNLIEVISLEKEAAQIARTNQQSEMAEQRHKEAVGNLLSSWADRELKRSQDELQRRMEDELHEAETAIRARYDGHNALPEATHPVSPTVKRQQSLLGRLTERLILESKKG